MNTHFQPRTLGPDEWLEAVPGERVAVRLHGDDVGGRFSVVESVAAPGTATPLHTHDAEEVFVIMRGRIRFAAGGRVIDAAAGDVVRVPAGEPHAWVVRGEDEVHMLAIFTPAGFEDIFPHLAAAVAVGPAEVAAVAAHYGAAVLGPSPFAD